MQQSGMPPPGFAAHEWQVPGGFAPYMLSPYVPANAERVQLVLDACRLGPDSVFFDAGCGDGVLVEAVVTRTPARAVGVEIDPVLARAAMARVDALAPSAASRARVLHEAVGTRGLRGVTSLCASLLPWAPAELRALIAPAVRSGTLRCAVVSGGNDVFDGVLDGLEPLTPTLPGFPGLWVWRRQR